MLQLTKLGGHTFALNPDLIEKAEATPDTVVTLVNGTRYVICESLPELADLINDYRATIIATAQMMTDRSRHPQPRDHHSARGSVVELRPGDR